MRSTELRNPKPVCPKRMRTRAAAGIALIGLAMFPAGARQANAAPAAPEAMDSQKAAMAMVQQASAAYQRGDYDRAADLYHAAWRAHGDPNLLCAAGQAAHMGGRPAVAKNYLTEFLKLPGSDPQRVVRARAILAEIEARQLDARVAEGEQALASDPVLAARIWEEVAVADAQRIDLLYKAGVARHKAGDLAGARSCWQAYLAKAPASAPFRAQAQARLNSLPSQAVSPAGPKPLAPVVAAASSDTAPAQWPAWAGIGGGVAALAGAAAVYLGQRDAAAAYERDTTKGSDGKIHAISWSEASERADSLRQSEAIAWGLTGAGVAAIGFGAWWWAAHPQPRVTLRPGAGSAGVVAAWQF